MNDLSITNVKSLQEIFDQVYYSLVAQGVASGTIKDHVFECQYRGDIGKCAAGFLIDDKHYDLIFDSKSMIVKDISVWNALVASGIPDTKEAAMLVYNLQIAHDDDMPKKLGDSMGKWKNSMLKIAEKFDLVMPYEKLD